MKAKIESFTGISIGLLIMLATMIVSGTSAFTVIKMDVNQLLEWKEKFVETTDKKLDSLEYNQHTMIQLLEGADFKR